MKNAIKFFVSISLFCLGSLFSSCNDDEELASPEISDKSYTDSLNIGGMGINLKYEHLVAVAKEGGASYITLNNHQWLEIELDNIKAQTAKTPEGNFMLTFIDNCQFDSVKVPTNTAPYCFAVDSVIYELTTYYDLNVIKITPRYEIRVDGSVVSISDWL